MENDVSAVQQAEILQAVRPLIDALSEKDAKKFNSLLDDTNSYTLEDFEEQINFIFDETGGIDKFNPNCLTTVLFGSGDMQADIFKYKDLNSFGIQYHLTFENQPNDWTVTLSLTPQDNGKFYIEFEDLHIL